MKLRFLPEAQQELDAAASVFDEARPGTGVRFVRATSAAIERVLAFPESGAVLRGELRRLKVRAFPYGVIYAINDEPWSSPPLHTSTVARLTGANAASVGAHFTPRFAATRPRAR